MKKLSLASFAASFTLCAVSQNIGIGTGVPRAKLHVSAGASGNTTPFSPMVVENSTNCYVNLLSPDINENGILFGTASNAADGGIVYNNSSNYNGMQFRTNGNVTRMVINNNGNVGIGTTTPGYPLDVIGRMRVSGSNPNDAGLWFNNAGVDRAFMGLENNDYIGFYGNQGAGWKFVMNTQTGALKVNGSEGNAGQVLQSNGSGAAPSWASATNQLFNNVFSFGLTSAVLTSGIGSVFNLPGLNQNITLAKTSKVMVSMHVAGYNDGCFGCGEAIMEFYVSVNGGSANFQYKSARPVNSSAFDEDSGFRVITLPAGVHNFNMRAQHNSGGNVNVYKDEAPGYGTRMTIIVISE